MFVIGHLRGAGGRPVFPIGGENAEVPIKVIGNADPRKKIGSRTLVYDKTGLMGALCASDYKEPKLIQTGSFIIDDQGRKNKKITPKNIVPTLRAQSHGNEPKVAIREATKQGYAEATVGDYVNLEFPNSKTRRGRVGKQVANTLLTSGDQGVVTETLKIRKLTPRECWRLQGFPDWAFDKAQEVNSNTQLYKQAGNSVTVNVIKEIAERLGE